MSKANGLTGNSTKYKLIRANNSAVNLVDKRGKKLSSKSSKSWDAVRAITTDTGFEVLLAGEGKKQGKFLVWSVDNSGKIFKKTKWLNASELDSHEVRAGFDLNGDNSIGGGGQEKTDAIASNQDAQTNKTTVAASNQDVQTNKTNLPTSNQDVQTNKTNLPTSNQDVQINIVRVTTNLDQIDWKNLGGSQLLNLDFSEPVKGFDISDLKIRVDNGAITLREGYYFRNGQYASKSGFDRISLWIGSYNDPPVDGMISITMPEGAAWTEDGKKSESFSYVSEHIDNVSPSLKIDIPFRTDYSTSEALYKLTFSEPVTSFSMNSIAPQHIYTDEPVSNKVSLPELEFQQISDGITYQILVKPPKDFRGAAGFSLDLSMVKDMSGNLIGRVEPERDSRIRRLQDGRIALYLLSDTESPLPKLRWDSPTPEILSNSDKYAFFQLEQVSYDASNSYQDLTRNDYIVEGGGVLQNVTDYGGVVMAPDNQEGVIRVSLPAEAYADASGNLSKPSNQISIPYDRKRPSIVATSKSYDELTGVAMYSFEFSERVTGFSGDTFSVYDLASDPNRYMDRKIPATFSSSDNGLRQIISFRPASVLDSSIIIDKVAVESSNILNIIDAAGNSLSSNWFSDVFNPLV